MKKIILLSLLIVVGVFVFGNLAYVDNATISALPASADSTVGSSLNVAVQLNPAGNKACVVSGNLTFSNLTCQNITVASGLKAMTAPSCSNPSFMVGIPNCTTAVQNLFSVSVKGVNAGQASLSMTSAKVIGAGSDVAFTLQNGVYNITAIPAIPVVTQKTTPKIPTAPATSTTPKQQDVEQPVQQTPQQAEIASQQQTSEGSNSSDNVAVAGLTATNSKSVNYLWIALALIIIVVVGYGLYYFLKKKKKQ